MKPSTATILQKGAVHMQAQEHLPPPHARHHRRFKEGSDFPMLRSRHAPRGYVLLTSCNRWDDVVKNGSRHSFVCI
jgi:hypothetical protein